MKTIINETFANSVYHDLCVTEYSDLTYSLDVMVNACGIERYLVIPITESTYNELKSTIEDKYYKIY